MRATQRQLQSQPRGQTTQKRESGLHFLPLLSVLSSSPFLPAPCRHARVHPSRTDLIYGAHLSYSPAPPPSHSKASDCSSNGSLMVIHNSDRLRFKMLILNELEQGQSWVSELIWLLKDRNTLELHIWPVLDLKRSTSGAASVFLSFFPTLVCDRQFKDEANSNL